jgi:hypothetical protein
MVMLVAALLVGCVKEPPATPMTVDCADRLFAAGVRPGQSREDVEAWLASQGIPPGERFSAKNTCYSVLRRREDVPKGGWMDCRGNRTVAECAGLDVDRVYSVICVTYPEADRFAIGYTTITVYLFFDAKGRLLRHWVYQFHVSL